MDKLEEQIRADLSKILTPEENKNFWNTTEQNVQKFDEKDNQNAQAALENDSYWKDDTKLDNDILSVIITENYRQKEYKRSEYASKNSKVVSLGTYHYIHFEYPREIARIVKDVAELE